MADDEKPTFTAEDLAVLATDDKGATGDAADTTTTTEDQATAGKDAAAATSTTGDAAATSDATVDDKTAAGKSGDGAVLDGKTQEEKDAVDWPDEGFPDNWRERTLKQLGLTGEALSKAEKRAKAAASPAELLRSVLSADSKIGELTAQNKGLVKLPTGKNDKPEEVAAFRKAAGIPDDPAKYVIPDPPKDLGERSDLDKEMIAGALKGLHGAHLNQAQVNEVIKQLDAAELAARNALIARATKVNDDAEEELRAAFGRDYKSNVELAERFIEQSLGEFMPEKADRQAFLNMRLEDGTRIGNHVPLVKWLAKMGRAAADDGDVPEGDSAAVVNVDKRIDEITALAHTKPKEYEKLQDELVKLIAIQNKRSARKSAA